MNSGVTASGLTAVEGNTASLTNMPVTKFLPPLEIVTSHLENSMTRKMLERI